MVVGFVGFYLFSFQFFFLIIIHSNSPFLPFLPFPPFPPFPPLPLLPPTQQIRNRVGVWDKKTHIGDVFLKLLDTLKMYSTYVNNYNSGLMELSAQQRFVLMLFIFYFLFFIFYFLFFIFYFLFFIFYFFFIFFFFLDTIS